jgi:hypothetical protein
MKTKLITTIMIMLFLASIIVIARPVKADTTINYGDITLSGGFQAGHFIHVWDLTANDLVISFTVDLTGMVDDYGGGAHAWAELGVRDTTTTIDFNPGEWITGGKGVWLATDYDWIAYTFDPDPPGSPTLDIDDKLILQRGGGADERYYDLPSAPPDPWTNYGIWFDRDGVDPWQATYWGCIDGGTYNTGGTYEVVITLHATSDTSGTAYMTVNGVSQGFWVTGWKNAQPEIYPAGMTFTGDMKHMQVFYGLYGYGAVHTVVFEDITVSGVLRWEALLEDLKAEIGDLPDEDFKRPAADRKAALIDKIDDVIAKIVAGDYKGAIMKLEKDIRPKLDVNAKQSWLVIGHAELLAKIEEVVGILEGLL